MFERLEAIKERNDAITKELTKPEVISDVKKVTKLSKEQSDLSEIIECYDAYLKAKNDYEEAKELARDPEMKEFAMEEEEKNLNKQKELEKQLEILLLPKDPNDGKNIIVEIRGAAGGDEGNIFAGDLYRMYTKYAEKEGWKTEPITEEYSEGGGFSLVSFMIKGKNVYSKMKYESGAHRVQRVPVTETQGRVHTSTATVLVMPEAEDLDFELDMSEVRIDITRSSGCGGQGVNTTDSAVRITHIPTNIVVTCQNERSQIQNKEQAMKILKSKLLLLETEKKNSELNSFKENQQNIEFGSQIRSYVMHPYSLVKDHRTLYETSNISKVLDGDINIFIEMMLKEDKNDKE